MKNKFIEALFIVGAVLLPGFVQADQRNLNDYNLRNGIALHGFDPVAVLPEGGAKPETGTARFVSNQKGVVYQFANDNHLQLFESRPERYEPSYGGYCAYAMASGCKVDIQPQIYSLKGDRIHYFVSARAKRNFDADSDRLEEQADLNYEKTKSLDLKLGECLP